MTCMEKEVHGKRSSYHTSFDNSAVVRSVTITYISVLFHPTDGLLSKNKIALK